MHRMTVGLVGVVLAALVGCGSSVVDDPASSGAGGSGGDTSVTNGTSGPNGSTGTGGACAGYADVAGAASVTVRFQNQSGLPIYLPATCGNVAYAIEPVGGPDGTSYTFDGSCLQTCEALQKSPPATCGACQELAFLVPAGGSLDVIWQGTGLRSGVAMPAQCFAGPGTGPCSQIVAAAAGSYRALVQGYGSCNAGDDGGCKCDPNGECYGSANGLQAYADPVKFDFPAASQVDVVFGPCAFGCAGGGGSG